MLKVPFSVVSRVQASYIRWSGNPFCLNPHNENGVAIGEYAVAVHIGDETHGLEAH